MPRIEDKRLTLKSGSRVGIVGGGPAGSFAALFLLNAAAERGIDLNVVIYDGKVFTYPGIQGCNMCAGVISAGLVTALADFGLRLPARVVQRDIVGYVFHTRSGTIELADQEGLGKICTVFRGNGPRYSLSTGNVSFDDYVLDEARVRGARVVSEPVQDITLPHVYGDRATIRYGHGQVSETDEVDLIIGGFGLNTTMTKKIERLGFGYRAPVALRTCMAEFQVDPQFVTAAFQNRIHSFQLRIPDIRFAAIVPKRNHLTVSVVGRRDLKFADLERFLDVPEVRQLFPPGWTIPRTYCHCHPKIAVSNAKQPYWDRLVLVGDANCSNFYKTGIESAFYTARFAVDSALEYGVSREGFAAGYAPEYRRRFCCDNRVGRLLYWAGDLAFAFDSLAEAQVALANRWDDRTSRVFRSFLWGMSTGDRPYRRIAKLLVDPGLVFGFSASAADVMIRKVWRRIVRAVGRRRPEVGADRAFAPIPGPIREMPEKPIKVRVSVGSGDSLGPVADGQTVGVIGGGPSGVGFALALHRMCRESGRRVHIVLYEPKDFVTNVNQCVGVLSPPLEEILETELDVRLPRELVSKKVAGYVLHSDANSILLRGEGNASPTYTVQRAKFDRYLLDEAIRRGVDVRPHAVTDIEFFPDRARIYSGDHSTQAHVVVGAFGLNGDMLDVLEFETSFRRPPVLKSIVTRIVADPKVIDANIGNTIHAFVPSLQTIEFGAVTPKRDHVVVNIVGSRVTSKDMDVFLSLPGVRSLLPPIHEIKYYKGKFPIGPAQNSFGDRFVTVGNAGGLIRPLKGKGVNSAVLTGARTARTVLEAGVSRDAFRQFYRGCQDLVADNVYGIGLRALVNLGSRAGLLDRVIEVAKSDAALYRAMFGIVSGNRTYRQIVHESLEVKLLARLGAELSDHLIRRLRAEAT